MGAVEKAGGEGRRGEEAHCAGPCEDLFCLGLQSPGECLEQRGLTGSSVRAAGASAGRAENSRQDEHVEEEETCPGVMPAIQAVEDRSRD